MNSQREPAIKLGKAIRNQRKLLKMSQSELAVIANVSLNFVSQIENGKPKAQLCKILDVLTALGLQFNIELGKSGIYQCIETTA